MSIKCHTCKADIGKGHEAHRGLIINAICSLTANLITSKEMLEAFRKRRSNNAEQQARDLAMTLNLQAQIIANEARLADLKKENEECYG